MYPQSRASYRAWLFYLSGVFVMLVSCQSKKNIAFYHQVVNETLENAAASIARSTRVINSELQNKLNLPATRARAEIWQPRAATVGQLCKTMTDYIRSVKKEISSSNSKMNSTELFDKIIGLRKQLLNVDKRITEVFDTTNSILVSASAFMKSKAAFNELFDNTSSEDKLTILNKLECDIQLAEYRITAFCNDNVPDNTEFFTSYSTIIAQSSNYVEAGDKVEITAGVGAFTREHIPSIKINGDTININESGTAIYKFNASSAPGKHIVPVEISFIDQDGRAQLIRQSVEYTVHKN